MRLCPEGAGGLPCVCTSRAIDLGLLFNDGGPGVCSVEPCGVGRRDSQRCDGGSEQEEGLRAWLRANRVIMWQIHTSLLISLCLVHRITLTGCRTTIVISTVHFR